MYVRPADLVSDNWHLVTAPMLATQDASLTQLLSFDPRRTIAIAYYVGGTGEGWDGFAHYGLGPGIRVGTGGAWQYPTIGDVGGGLPGESKYATYNWTLDASELDSSTTNYYYAGYNALDGDGNAIFPAPAFWQFRGGTMEMFTFDPPEGEGGGDAYTGVIGPCDPVPRPPFPYQDPYLAVAGGPPGVVRRRR